MGASAWAQFVPYRKNIAEAIRDEQARMWAEGDYIVGWTKLGGSDYRPIYARDLPSDERPQTLDELLERMRMWSYGILSYEPEWIATKYKPVSDDRLMKLFGTTKPGPYMEPDDDEWNELDGNYIVFYEHGSPSAYWFYGCDEHK